MVSRDAVFELPGPAAVSILDGEVWNHFLSECVQLLLLVRCDVALQEWDHEYARPMSARRWREHSAWLATLPPVVSMQDIQHVSYWEVLTLQAML